MVKKVYYENEYFVLVRDRVEVRQTSLIITTHARHKTCEGREHKRYKT